MSEKKAGETEEKTHKGGTRHGYWETAAVVASWFVLNIAMGSSTKWIYLYGEICLDSPVECSTFKFPLAITVIHMVFSWGMCYVQLHYIRARPMAVSLTFREQLSRVAPLSVCFSLSVAMGNMSLQYIYPSFNQMLGSMSPLITVLMAVVLQRTSYNWWTWLSMPVICGGLALCSAKEVNFNAVGAFYATGATILRALKSIMQSRLLSSGDKLDSVTLLFYMAPWAALFLSFIGIFSEGLAPHTLLLQGLLGSTNLNSGVSRAWEDWSSPSSGRPSDPDYRSVSGGSRVLCLLFVSGLNACLLNVANFMVTAYTSSVTLQVLGNIKGCLAIGVSVAIFRNPLAAEQALGVVACLFGVWLYNEKGGQAKLGHTSAASSDSEGSVEMQPAVLGSSSSGVPVVRPGGVADKIHSSAGPRSP